MSHYGVITTKSENGDRTNIGVVVFSNDGKQFGCRIAPIAFAKHRGDWPEDDDGEWVKGWAEEWATVELYKKRIETTGHAMSFLQLGPLGGSLSAPEVLLATIYARFVRET